MSDKFISYDKLSKKDKKKIDLMSRRGWGNVRPVTRIENSSKKYSRKQKHKRNFADDE